MYAPWALAEGASTRSVDSFNVLKDLGICSNLNAHDGGEIGKAGTGHDGSRAEGGRNATVVGEGIQRAHNMVNHVT